MTFALKQNMTESPKKRTLSRLAAVQAMYQQTVTGMVAGDVVEQFQSHNFKQTMEDISLSDLDRELFNDLMLGASARIADIDKMIESNLAEGWTIKRLDPLLHAILRCAVYELWCRTDIPPKVSISEYVSLTADFYDGSEPGFVNGILDKIAGHLREPTKSVK